MPATKLQTNIINRLNGVLDAFTRESAVIQAMDSPQSKMMFALTAKAERHGKGTIYEGTVPAHVIAKRRARNKMARRSRAANRR